VPARRSPFAARSLAACLVSFVTAAAFAPHVARAQSPESAAELLREAREHESNHDDLVAVRRYSDALALDPTLGDAYLGLGALRLRLGDAREAERVFDVALSRVPSLHRALVGRAEARWALGLRAEAEDDLELYAREAEDPGALRELAEWYANEARIPAQLATWRHIRAMANERGDATLEHEAQTMVRALQILVGSADPVTKPLTQDPTRRGIARVATRGG
jgi:tetratricopeptide (TPR) repeat protein